MMRVVDPGAGPLQAVWPEAAPAACVDPRIAGNVLEIGINSQDAAFETGLSAQSWNRASSGSDNTALREGVRAAMAVWRLAGRELPANGRQSPGRAD